MASFDRCVLAIAIAIAIAAMGKTLRVVSRSAIHATMLLLLLQSVCFEAKPIGAKREGEESDLAAASPGCRSDEAVAQTIVAFRRIESVCI